MTAKDAIKAAEAATKDSPDITISLSDFAKARKALAAETSWKWKILSYLKNNQGSTDLQVYEGTRGPTLEEAKAKKSLASQYTYLRDEGALILKEEGTAMKRLTALGRECHPTHTRVLQKDALPGLPDLGVHQQYNSP